MQDFEKCLGDFLSRSEYDNAETALFAIVRLAFKAGWIAAGGNPPQRENLEEQLGALRAVSAEEAPDCRDIEAETGGEF